MMTPKEHFHGSDLEKIEAFYHIRKDEIVQFGANVNPLGLSEKLRTLLVNHLDVITDYPDREYGQLRNTIANYCGCDASDIIVGNGSTELISLTVAMRHPKEAMILAPAYSEYEREVSLNGGKIIYFPLKEEDNFGLDISGLCESIKESTDLLIICNPNNPTSSVLHQPEMKCILERAQETGTLVMIDETYVEFAKDYPTVTSIPLIRHYSNLIILRGISKFFASPGLRLGYAITSNRALRASILEHQNPWSINSLAEVAARLMFTDKDYIEATKKLIDNQRDYCVNRLRNIEGLKVYEPHANFVLIKILDHTHSADALFDLCIRQKLMIRDCSTFMYLDESFFRFCFMNPNDNEKLLDCIEEFMK